jgi:hypothetical protein
MRFKMAKKIDKRGNLMTHVEMFDRSKEKLVEIREKHGIRSIAVVIEMILDGRIEVGKK